MEKKEFAIFADALKTYYPKEDKLLPNAQAMELWYRQLQDIPYPVIEAALLKWVSTNKWSPSIAEIREMSSNIQNGDIPDWGEGWEKTRRAVRKFGMYNEKAALDSLDPLTRKVVERLGFREFCVSDENDTTFRANFRMIYENLANREKTEQQLALPLREAIAQIQLKGFDGQPLLIGDKNGN
jgi:hypothetical protein